MNGSASRRSLPTKAQQRRAKDRQKLARRHQVEAFGNRNQSAVADDECPAARFVGRDQFVFHSQPAAEIERGGRRGEKVVGRSLDEEAVALDGFEHAAEAIGCFEKR